MSTLSGWINPYLFTAPSTPLEYPPAAMTGNTTAITASYGSGTYVVTYSSWYSAGGTTFDGWRAFNKAINSNESWTSATATYNTSGVYVGGATLGGYSGEWITLSLPTAISLTSYSLTSFYYTSGDYYNATASSWVVLGSNDGTNWTLVDQRSGIAYTAFGVAKTFTLATASSAYNRYAFVVRATQGNGSSNSTVTQLGEIRYFGY